MKKNLSKKILVTKNKKEIWMHKFDYETMFFSFASLIEKYENNFRENLMRIYEKLENDKEDLKKIFKKSYGYLVTRPNVKFLKNENSEKEIYGYIYVHEWGNKNEISFWMKPNWKEKDSLDISYKRVLDFFLEDWFKEGTNFSSNREKILIWATREIAKISIKMALDYHFICLFSFFNYDGKKNQKTHYFYNYKNRFFEKQGNNFFKLHQKNKTSLLNSSEFTFFTNFFKTKEINFEQKRMPYIQNNFFKQHYYKIKNSLTNTTVKKYFGSKESQNLKSWKKIEWEIFNIFVNDILLSKIEDLIISKNMKLDSIEKIRIIFHDKLNILQLEIFTNKFESFFSVETSNYDIWLKS